MTEADAGDERRSDVDPAERRPYNRPRRYPVPAAPADDPQGPELPVEVTRQNPTLAEAAQDYERRHGPLADAPGAPAPDPHPAGPGPGAHPTTDGADVSRTVSRRTVLVGVAVLAVIAVIGLVVGLSGGNDSTPKAGPHAGGPPGAGTSSSVAAGTPPSTEPTSTEPPPTEPTPTLPPSTLPPSSPGPSGGDGSAADVCARLGATAPLTTFVGRPRPVAQMPVTYVEPDAGTRVAVCVGAFRPGGGPGRGQLAYLAEYARLPATQYAAKLRTLGWVPVPSLPQPTYRNNLTTTVTLVQEGTTLVTVVGTGR